MTIYEKTGIAPTASAQRMRRVVRALRFALAALGAGSRTVAPADNSQVVRELSAQAKYLYASK
jgi:hypothetical protein